MQLWTSGHAHARTHTHAHTHRDRERERHTRTGVLATQTTASNQLVFISSNTTHTTEQIKTDKCTDEITNQKNLMFAPFVIVMIIIDILRSTSKYQFSTVRSKVQIPFSPSRHVTSLHANYSTCILGKGKSRVV